MTKLVPAGKSLLVGVVAVGALSLGVAGISGVAASAGTAGAAAPTGRHVNCAQATRALTRIERNEARITARLPKLKANEAKAAAKGKTARAARLEKRIERWESSAFKANLTERLANIEARCKVSAPPVP